LNSVTRLTAKAGGDDTASMRRPARPIASTAWRDRVDIVNFLKMRSWVEAFLRLLAAFLLAGRYRLHANGKREIGGAGPFASRARAFFHRTGMTFPRVDFFAKIAAANPISADASAPRN